MDRPLYITFMTSALAHSVSLGSSEEGMIMHNATDFPRLGLEASMHESPFVIAALMASRLSAHRLSARAFTCRHAMYFRSGPMWLSIKPPFSCYAQARSRNV